MFTMLPFALVPETAEAAQTLELSCKCLASYKPWHKASLAVEFILWWSVIPNSSRSCVENKLQQGRHQAVAISGRSNKQVKKVAPETRPRSSDTIKCKKRAQTSEACKQIGSQKLEAWASGLVNDKIYRKARTKIKARNSNALKGYKGNNTTQGFLDKSKTIQTFGHCCNVRLEGGRQGKKSSRKKVRKLI